LAVRAVNTGSDKPSSRLVGQVLNQAGQPVAGAEVRVRGSRSGTIAQGLFQQTVKTDDSGAFELDGGLPGRWQLQVSHPNYNSLTEEVWLFANLTTPIDIQLSLPIQPQPRTRLGVIGVGTLAHTEFLSQRLAAEAVRLELVPNTAKVLPLDNRNLQPILERIGRPLYDVLEADEIEPEAVNQFFDLLGLEALVVARVDVLSNANNPEEISLKSRSRLELWTIDDNGEVAIEELAAAERDETESSDLNSTDLEQLYQIQVTRMATEIGDRWKEEEENPLAAYTAVDPKAPPPPRNTIETTVQLAIPNSNTATMEEAPEFPAPLLPTGGDNAAE
jgi:hypothetical protein